MIPLHLFDERPHVGSFVWRDGLDNAHQRLFIRTNVRSKPQGGTGKVLGRERRASMKGSAPKRPDERREMAEVVPIVGIEPTAGGIGGEGEPDCVEHARPIMRPDS